MSEQNATIIHNLLKKHGPLNQRQLRDASGLYQKLVTEAINILRKQGVVRPQIGKAPVGLVSDATRAELKKEIQSLKIRLARCEEGAE